jgi:lysozyme
VRLHSYRDSGGTLTIGIGHTGKSVHENQTITKEQADEFLEEDLVHAEHAIDKYVTVPLSQGQYNALSSFTFNLGTGALHSSTLLKDLNKKEYQKAADQFLKWDHVNGVEVAGLTKRRKAERKMFLA